jgi:hypothetical protein
MKVFVTHPKAYDTKGGLLPLGEQEVSKELGESLIKRKLATTEGDKKLEVATPSKAPTKDGK